MDDQALCRAIVELRKAAPDHWRKFLEEYETLAGRAQQTVDGAVMGLSRENFDTFLDNRGWARAALFLLRSFKDPESRLQAPKKPTTETSSRL